MTSEVVLMNRRSIALAADSASTITTWHKGEKSQRYFKGTNKIFNLSYKAPVALMIYDSADLYGVPWEIIIKAYRNSIRGKAFNHLVEYAEDFFKFIENNQDLYPSKFRLEQLIDKVIILVLNLLYWADANQIIKEEKDEIIKKEKLNYLFNKLSQDVDKEEFIGTISQKEIDNLLKEHKDAFITKANSIEKISSYKKLIEIEKLIEIAVKALLKEKYSTLDPTGLLITGFGEKDYFPILKHYNCYGILENKLLCKVIEEINIDQKNSSAIIPIAQSTMAKTFMHGISAEAFELAYNGIKNTIDKFQKSLRDKQIISAEINVDDIKSSLVKDFINQLVDSFFDAHTNPMKRVVGLLPIDELAELAEMFVRMESLKERVTRSSEEVSGPVDVAVISKGDGFIWIKRKHYFDPKLNPRFFNKKEEADV